MPPPPVPRRPRALGAAGLPESWLRRLAPQVGFSKTNLVLLDNPFKNLYEPEV